MQEAPGRALVDAAAQHELIGRDTLAGLDQYLQETFGLREQHSNEGGGTVRGVCGAEEKTPIAYISIGAAVTLGCYVCKSFLEQSLASSQHIS